MLRNNVFALASVLALGLGVAACGDDKGNDPVDGTPDGTGEIPAGQTVYSYVAGISIPEDGCCADLGGADAENDNGLGELIPLLGSLGLDFDLGELLNGVFEDGSLTLLFQYKNMPSLKSKKDDKGDMAIFLGTSESSAADRMSGKGVFALDGPAVTTAKVGVNNYVLSVDASSLTLTLDLSAIAGDLGIGAISLPLSPVKLLMDASVDNGGIANSNATSKLGKPINYLTGGVSIDSVVGIINDLVADCDGAPATGWTSYDQTTQKLSINGEISGDGLCDDLNEYIPLAEDLLGTFLDLDTDGDGNGDALSLGVRIKVVAATVAP